MGECNREIPWFALQVRSCREKTATRYLESEGYECFLPLGKSRRRWSDRIKVLDVPLFPGYLFCRFDPNNRLPVLKAPGVIQIVGIGKTLIPVDDEEVAALQRVGKGGFSAQPWSFLQVGQTARIEYGPLRGLTGIIVHIKSEYKLVLSVTLLQRSVAVEIDGGWLADPQPMRVPAVEIAPATLAGPDRLAARRRVAGTDRPPRSSRGGKLSALGIGGIDAWQESGAL
jgi:transcription antitermination factor NusG